MGLRRYTFRSYCKENRKLLLPDRGIKIFFNIHGTIGNESPEMLAFLDYMATGRTQGTLVAAIDAEVRKIKADQEQKEIYMSLALDYMDDLKESYDKGWAGGEAKGEARGEARGEAMRSRTIAQRLLRRKLPLDLIAEDTGLTMDELRELQLQQQ